MKQTIKKALIWLLLIAVVYLLFFPVPIRVQKEVQAVEVSLADKSLCTPMTVSVDGVYRWRLLFADTFTGDLSFSGYPLTEKQPLTTGKGLPSLRLEKGRDLLEYGPWMESDMFGWLHTTPCFGRFAVQVMEKTEGNRGGSWSSEEGRCIVAPAKTREEALKVLKHFSKDGSELPPYEDWIN